MYLIDAHCHLDHERFADDLDAVIKKCEDAGVRAIITQGVTHENNVRVLALAKKYSIVKAALGLYPTMAKNVCASTTDEYGRCSAVSVDDTLQFIYDHKDEIVAIGEVGIDLKESDDLATQIENFKKVIALAKQINKPLIIHTRKAEKEIIDVLEASKINKRLVQLHCFCGKKAQAKRAIALGYMFSIPCCITRAENFQLLVSMVPITQLLTETDGPYMPPDKEMLRSEPHHVLSTMNIIARIKNMTPEEVADSIFMNYQRMYL